jgi:anti-anti-sigma regulatory factor
VPSDLDILVIRPSDEYKALSPKRRLPRELLPAIEYPYVVIDFSEVTHIDSTALARLVA